MRKKSSLFFKSLFHRQKTDLISFAERGIMSSTTLQKGKYLKEMKRLKQTSLEVQLIGENAKSYEEALAIIQEYVIVI